MAKTPIPVDQTTASGFWKSTGRRILIGVLEGVDGALDKTQEMALDFATAVHENHPVAAARAVVGVLQARELGLVGPSGKFTLRDLAMGAAFVQASHWMPEALATAEKNGDWKTATRLAHLETKRTRLEAALFASR